MHRRIVRIEKRNFPTRHRQLILPRSSILWIEEQPLAGDDVQVRHRLILPWSPHQVHIEHFSMISRWTIFDSLTQSGVDVADGCPSSSSSNVPDLLKTTVERWNSVDVCDRFVRFQCDCLLVVGQWIERAGRHSTELWPMVVSIDRARAQKSTECRFEWSR